MATRQRRPASSGRITPKGVTPRPANAKTAAAKAPRAHGPQDPATPVAVGRRPSSPAFLAVVAVMWLAVGVILFLTLSTAWRLIPAIFAFGIGLLFLRGAASTILRRSSGE